MKLPPGFTKKEFQETSDEYLKGLFGIKDTKKADKKGANKERSRIVPVTMQLIRKISLMKNNAALRRASRAATGTENEPTH